MNNTKSVEEYKMGYIRKSMELQFREQPFDFYGGRLLLSRIFFLCAQESGFFCAVWSLIFSARIML